MAIVGWPTYFVFDVVQGFDVLAVELQRGEGAQTMEGLILVPVLPTDRFRWAT